MNSEKIQTYIDKVAIQEVLATYSICVDTGDADGFAAIFTEDGLWEWEAVQLSFCGRVALKKLAETVYTHAKGSQHAISNPVITVESDRAKSICQLTSFLSKPEQIYTLMLGYYEDELIKVNDRWQISHRSVRIENPEVLAQGKVAEYFAPLGTALTKLSQDHSA